MTFNPFRPNPDGKTYVLKKDCPNIGKEIGDYYNHEYRQSIEELIEKGVIEEETDEFYDNTNNFDFLNDL